MRRVLFVDDEQNVLDGLQNMLRRQRNIWNMSFVSSGDQAIARLAAEPFGLIVSDMRMPGPEPDRAARERLLLRGCQWRAVTSKRSAFMTLVHAATKSRTNLSLPSSCA